MQYIYLLESAGYYKIGIANNVLNRIVQLSTGNPNEILLKESYGFENAQLVEQVLHQRFSNERIRGEWFLFNHKHLKDFTNICLILGGISGAGTSDTPSLTMAEAESFQEIFDSDHHRIEPRYTDGVLRGFAIRERNKKRKTVAYIGKNSADFKVVYDLVVENDDEA